VDLAEVAGEHLVLATAHVLDPPAGDQFHVVAPASEPGGDRSRTVLERGQGLGQAHEDQVGVSGFEEGGQVLTVTDDESALRHGIGMQRPQELGVLMRGGPGEDVGRAVPGGGGECFGGEDPGGVVDGDDVARATGTRFGEFQDQAFGLVRSRQGRGALGRWGIRVAGHPASVVGALPLARSGSHGESGHGSGDRRGFVDHAREEA
jgi:hypothetical protein